MSTGSVLVDMALRLPSMPQIGGDVIASPPTFDVGGGFNLVYAAARQGADVVYAGRHGSGPHGDMVRAALADIGVRAVQPPARDGDTGLCITFVDDSAERSFVTAAGVEAILRPDDLEVLTVDQGDLVAVSGYDLTYEDSHEVLSSWLASLEPGTTVLLDPGPLVMDIPPSAWARAVAATSVLTINDREAAFLCGAAETQAPPDVHRAIRRDQDLADTTLLVIRHGAGGCSASGGEVDGAVLEVPAIAVEAVDSTGAGDTHTGVLLAGLAAELPLPEALFRANVAAAVSVTRRGPASSPDRAELEQIIQDHSR